MDHFSQIMNKKFPRNLDSLENIYGFITGFVSIAELDKHLHFQIDLVVEELFTNMIKYDHDKLGGIELKLERRNNRLIITMTDFNVHRFDPTRTQPYNINSDLKSRPVGKLGIHLIKQIVDRIEYCYLDNNSIIKMTKQIGPAYV